MGDEVGPAEGNVSRPAGVRCEHSPGRHTSRSMVAVGPMDLIGSCDGQEKGKEA